MNLEKYDKLKTRQKVEYFESLPDSRKQTKKLLNGIGTYDLNKPTKISFKFNGKSYGRQNPVFSLWSNMLERCYSASYQKRSPTYKGVTVCKEWLIFSNFYSWWKINYVEGWQLDKDILTDRREYSPENCLYVPRWLNLFTGGNNARRGEYLIGVYWHGTANKFISQCSDGEGNSVHIGIFDSELDAHLAWIKYKLTAALKRKPEMDEIDARIYNRILEIIGRSM